MNVTTRGATATVALVSAIVLGACGPDAPTQEPSVSPTSTMSLTASQSPSPSPSAKPTDSNSPQARAQATVVQYWAMLDNLASDPSTSLSDLATVARGSALTQWQQILTKRRGQQYTQTGRVSVEDARVKANGPGRWDVSACIDASGANVVDKNGKSVRGTGPLRVRSMFVVERDRETYFVTEEDVVEEC